jgi:hypothetical protein
VAPAPCASDADCPKTRCLHIHLDDGSEGPGFCEQLKQGAPTLGVPAQCERDSDCGGKRACLHVHDASGAELSGFCQMDALACPRFCETSAEAHDSVCQSDADCGEARCGDAICAF